MGGLAAGAPLIDSEGTASAATRMPRCEQRVRASKAQLGRTMKAVYFKEFALWCVTVRTGA